MKVDKLIITNRAALKKKYKEKFSVITDLLKKIVAADKKRGLNSKIAFVDEPGTMKPVKGKIVTSIKNEKQNKEAIDALYKFYTSDYLMIFGSSDVIPFQNLTNDNFLATMSNADSDDDDGEEFVESDLPYASDNKYSKKTSDFTNPSRVIGRLPDLLEIANIKYFTQVVNNSINWKPLKSMPQSYFALSAAFWNQITNRILKESLKTTMKSQVSPPRRENNWKKNELSKRLHLYNCHGGQGDNCFYGQKNEMSDAEPSAISSLDINKKISKGTVVVAECCFGGEQYPPKVNPMGICSSFLFNGAIGFVGSSTSAFGAVNGDKKMYNADLIALYFFQHLATGASLGRAFLETRQEFLRKNDQPDPLDLKTIAQFYLLGDPSNHLWLQPSRATPKSKKGRDRSGSVAMHRKSIRIELTLKSVSLENRVCTLKKKTSPVQPRLKKEISSILKEFQMPAASKGKVFEVQLPAQIKKLSKKKAIGKKNNMNIKYHLYGIQKRSSRKNPVIRIKRILVLRELNGDIIDKKMVESK